MEAIKNQGKNMRAINFFVSLYVRYEPKYRKKNSYIEYINSPRKELELKKPSNVTKFNIIDLILKMCSLILPH